MSGPQCCSNPPTLNPNSGAGHFERVGGLDSYVIGSLDSKRAVLLVSDIFGYEAPNLRKLADKIAAAGFYVVVPDFFNADVYVPENTARPIMEWLKDHGADKGFEDAKPGSIQAAALLHPSFVTVDDIKEVKTPIQVLGAEIDHISPPALVKQFEEVDSYVKIFPNVTHGWTVRYKDDDEAEHVK
ncbi:hypothetical protein Tsubulata_033132, partial [Turnera subulata]